jgi:hypothetical protein
MDKGNTPAIIAFGRLTIAYAFSSPHPAGSTIFAGRCSSTGVPGWLSLLRGVWGVSAMPKALDNRIEVGKLGLHNHVVQDFADSVDLSSAQMIIISPLWDKSWKGCLCTVLTKLRR